MVEVFLHKLRAFWLQGLSHQVTSAEYSSVQMTDAIWQSKEKTSLILFTQLWYDCLKYQCHSSSGLLQCVTPSLTQEEKLGGGGYSF